MIEPIVRAPLLSLDAGTSGAIDAEVFAGQAGLVLVKIDAIARGTPSQNFGALHGGFAGTTVSLRGQTPERVTGFSWPHVDAGLCDYVLAPHSRLIHIAQHVSTEAAAVNTFYSAVACGIAAVLCGSQGPSLVYPAESPICRAVARHLQDVGGRIHGIYGESQSTLGPSAYERTFDGWRDLLNHRDLVGTYGRFVSIEGSQTVPLSILEHLAPCAVWVCLTSSPQALMTSLTDPRVLLLSIHRRLEMVIASQLEDVCRPSELRNISPEGSFVGESWCDQQMSLASTSVADQDYLPLLTRTEEPRRKP